MALPKEINGHIGSYYAASANPAPNRPALSEQIEADICIVGAGYSGLSTALTLAEKGHKVTILEAHRVGWGASGRNGGQIVNGLNADLPRIARWFGRDVASFVGEMWRDGGNLIRNRIERYDIQCDLKQGNLFTALTEKHMQALHEDAEISAKYGYTDLQILDAAQLREHIGSDVYAGGLIDPKGGHIHPLNLALGEAAAIEGLGGVIYENSPVISVDYTGAKPIITTQEGRVTAQHLVLCGNAYLGGTVPALAPRVLPVSTQVMATEPLGDELANELLPTDLCVEDNRYILDYYRLSADKRLLFGGGTVYGGRDVGNVIAKLQPNMVKVFPQLQNTKIDYAWNGNFALSFSRVPQMGRLADHTWFAHGYSGHGITGSHLFGNILGEAIDGDLSRFDTFAKLRWYPFPGGRLFGAHYSTLGSWYYGLRDKLGL